MELQNLLPENNCAWARLPNVCRSFAAITISLDRVLSTVIPLDKDLLPEEAQKAETEQCASWSNRKRSVSVRVLRCINKKQGWHSHSCLTHRSVHSE